MPYCVSLEDGKYKVINYNGILEFFRYEEPWEAASDLKFCGVVLAMMHRIQELEEVIYKANKVLQKE